MQLFDIDEIADYNAPDHLIPLAERMRAETLDDYLGQKHIAGEKGIIRSFVKNKTLFSLILWGPPGSGKTTLAKILAKESDAKFFDINAVSSSVKELREIIAKAKDIVSSGRRVLLFIDEIHRFNKAQQDALLHSVERGIITLIGATTENPSFEVNSALLSRCRTLTLNALEEEDLASILEKALREDVILSKKNITIDKSCKDIFIEAAGGDARKLLNLLEITIKISDNETDDRLNITADKIKTALLSDSLKYDKKGEYHYDVISAFIKSVRGSDPDAAVYYLARMLNGGEDPKFIARRLIILASEDIGNASPNGLLLAKAAFDSIHIIGMPEARIILAQATTYLASQPKSNAAYLAINKAMETVKQTGDRIQVPLHLRNAPTKLMKELNYGKEYKYSHDYENHFAAQQFLPDELKNEQFYLPTENGLEKGIKERLKALWAKIKRY